MSDQTQKCALLKTRPHIVKKEVEFILRDAGVFDAVDKICEETVGGKRWIVLFKNGEDAAKCMSMEPWNVKIDEKTVGVVFDSCPENIIPDGWLPKQGEAESWVVVDEDTYSSVSSSELFAGESLPFQATGLGLNTSNKTSRVDTSRHTTNRDRKQNSTERNDSGNINCDSFGSTFSDSHLFGSGYKGTHKAKQTSGTDSDASINQCLKDTFNKHERNNSAARQQSTERTRNSKELDSIENKIDTGQVDISKQQESRIIDSNRKSGEMITIYKGPNSAEHLGSRPVAAPRKSKKREGGEDSLPQQLQTPNQSDVQQVDNEPSNTSGLERQYMYPNPFMNLPQEFMYYPGYNQLPMTSHAQQQCFMPYQAVYNPNQDTRMSASPVPLMYPQFMAQNFMYQYPRMYPPNVPFSYHVDSDQHARLQGHTEQRLQSPEIDNTYLIPKHLRKENIESGGYANDNESQQSIDPTYLHPMIPHQRECKKEVTEESSLEPCLESSESLFKPGGNLSEDKEKIENAVSVSETDRLKITSDQTNATNEEKFQMPPIPKKRNFVAKINETNTEMRPKPNENHIEMRSSTDMSSQQQPSRNRQHSSEIKQRAVLLNEPGFERDPLCTEPMGNASQESYADELTEFQEPIYEEIICDSLPNEEVNKLDSPDKIPDLKPVPRGRKLPSIPTSSTETPSFLELHNNRLKSCDFEDLQSNTVEENEPNFQKRPEEERKHSTNKIIVTGFKKTTSLDSMVYFFENKRKSGGDDVIGKKLNSHPDSLVLEFEDHSVVQSIMEKQMTTPFRLDGATLTVAEYQQPSIDKQRLYLTGLKEGTSTESLKLFLEVICGMSPAYVQYGETPGTALLTFHKAPDFEKLQESLKKRSLDDQFLTVDTVEVSRQVKVTGYAKQTLDDTLIFFFENKRSGGGDVVNVIREEDRILVEFRNTEDAERVCDGRPHVLEKHELTVCLYYKCLDLDPAFIIEIPPPIRLIDMDPNIVNFMKTTKYKAILENSLCENFATAIWPSNDSEPLVVECTIDPKGKSQHVAKDWEHNCRETVNRMASQFDVNEEICVEKEFLSQTLDALNQLCVPDPDDIAVFVKRNEMVIVVCGVKKAVDKLYQTLIKVVTSIEDNAMEKTRVIEKRIKLQMYQIALLNVIRYLDQINFKKLDVTLRTENRTLFFSGQKSKVDEVVSRIYEMLQGFVRKSFPTSKAYKDMMFAKEVRDYIKRKMIQKKVIGVWNVVKGDELVYMYSKTAKQAQVAIDIVLNSLIQKTIPLDLAMEEIIYGDKCKSMLDQLTRTHEGLLKLEIETGLVTIIAADFIVEEVYEEVKQFFELHVIREDFMDVASGVLCYIDRFCRESLNNLETQYKSLSVLVELVDASQNQGFRIKGKKDGRKLAFKQLQKLIERVCTEEHSIVSAYIDLNEFLVSTQGKHELCDIELKENCILKVRREKDDRFEKSTEKAIRKQAVGKVKACEIIVIEGDLTELTVDTIVCPRDIYMRNNDGLAGRIITKGGYEIQKQCESFLNYHNISYSDVVSGAPGSLHCKRIFHVIIPEWRGGNHKEEELLQAAVKNCIEKLPLEQLSSIAFPAIGTGIFRFPNHRAVLNIVKSIQSSLTDKVKQVYLCCDTEEDFKGFIKEINDQLPDAGLVSVRQAKEEMQEGASHDTRKKSGWFPLTVHNEHSEMKTSIQITIIKGGLSRQKADVIVNTTNLSLDLRIGTVSRSLIKEGGDIIMQELKRKYPDGIQVGKIARSSGGNLQCKEIYHGVLNKWDQGQGVAERVMREFVLRCLELADQRGMTSIAFPALGTGMLGFPADVVAKLFYTCIDEYESKHAETGISSMFLVVYPGDTATIKAFEYVESSLQKTPVSDQISDNTPRFSFADTFTMTPADINKSHHLNIGPVTITIQQGDITKEKTGIVVNSVLEDLKLSSGQVSRAILNAAGSSLQLECHQTDNLERMKTNGYIVTGPGNMLCGRILHTKARSRSSNWAETVIKCLKETEQKGASSISFPALGTGGKGCNPESVAKAMFSGFKQYINSSGYKSILKSIRIVIFQADMVKTFVKASKEDTRPPRNILERFRHRQQSSKVVFRIYADSKHKIIKAKRALDGLIMEEKLFFRNKIINNLSDKQVNVVKQMAQDKYLSLHMNPQTGCITIAGASVNLPDVKSEITAYINNIEKDEEAMQLAKVVEAAAAKSEGPVTLPRSWGKMTMNDATQVIGLQVNDPDYLAVYNKFMTEVQGYATGVVKIERIQNPTLFTQYMAKMQQMEHANAGRTHIEQTLWHGTSGAVVANINNKGFDRNYNSGASHGIGVYFATKAATSVSGYCRPDATGQKYIYVAKVLTGDYCVGQGATRLPPQKPTGVSTDRYDSTTDNMAAPNFFVIFHDSQAYPEFLITFV